MQPNSPTDNELEQVAIEAALSLRHVDPDEHSAVILAALKGVRDSGAEAFDISDGRNRYRPCPRCGSDHGMGLVTTNRAIAVTCALCNFRGPAMSGEPAAWKDKWAFDAWNDIPREQARIDQLEQQLRDAQRALESGVSPYSVANDIEVFFERAAGDGVEQKKL